MSNDQSPMTKELSVRHSGFSIRDPLVIGGAFVILKSFPGGAMPIADKDVRWVETPKMGLYEKLYIPAIVEGLLTSGRHIFQKPVTQQYPEQEPDLPPNYRGAHRLNR